VDPYLSDALARKYRGHDFPHDRMMPPPVAPEELRAVNAVLCTHRHTDHMDPETLSAVARASLGCLFVVPRAEEVYARSIGVPAERVRGMAAGELVPLCGDCGVRALPAAHESLSVNDRGEHHHLGYVLSLGALRIYHSGDCVPYDGLAQALRSLGVHMALLPVNGRSERLSAKGFAGNFNFEEAVGLCRDAEIPWLICHHVGMFAFNTVSRQVLERKASALQTGFPRCVLPDVGVMLSLRREHPTP
jgi:L-ascorbate metabolism protein UlaG (beta-lactamase superfamily)